jgi:hypothetical protein
MGAMASISSNEIRFVRRRRIDGHRRRKQRSPGRFQPLELTCLSFLKDRDGYAGVLVGWSSLVLGEMTCREASTRYQFSQLEAI